MARSAGRGSGAGQRSGAACQGRGAALPRPASCVVPSRAPPVGSAGGLKAGAAPAVQSHHRFLSISMAILAQVLRL